MVKVVNKKTNQSVAKISNSMFHELEAGSFMVVDGVKYAIKAKEYEFIAKPSPDMPDAVLSRRVIVEEV